MNKDFMKGWLVLLSALALTACGSGDDDVVVSPTPSPAPSPTPAPPAADPPTSTSASAATTTASSNSACTDVAPFYWEIGNNAQMLASGQVNGSGDPVDATTAFVVASASKWMYSSYVVQKHADSGQALSATADVPFLNFTSGYTNMGDGPSCPTITTETVQDCAEAPTLALNASGNNDDLVSATQGHFYYDSAHMQVHAVNIGLGPDGDDSLSGAISDELGIDSGTGGIAYAQPLLAGGISIDAAHYGQFLRRIMTGQLAMHANLDANPVCAWVGTGTSNHSCDALYSPLNPSDGSASEEWHYSLGHWVEDDPVVGDHAYSSAGAFGFYPWIDKDQNFYGILSRHQEAPAGSGIQEGFLSAKCGRLIRAAWETGNVQSGPNPVYPTAK